MHISCHLPGEFHKCSVLRSQIHVIEELSLDRKNRLKEIEKEDMQVQEKTRT
jgi:hypothetical protein